MSFLKTVWFWSLLWIISGCDSSSNVIQIEGSKFGTTYRVLVNADQIPPENLESLIEERLELIDISMSTYRIDSEISRFNQLSKGEKLIVSDDFSRVFNIAKKVWEVSDKSFNPAIAPLVNLWGFGPDLINDRIPSHEKISEILPSTKFSNATLITEKGNELLLKLDEISLDFSGVAKGYAADVIADLLELNALPDYLVEIGGEMRVSGTNAKGTPWRIAIESPSELKQIETIISGVNAGIATSGDYRNYFETENRRYSHTLDPRSGYPVKHSLASVTVIAPTCAEADALATAIMVLGREEGLRIAEELKLAIFLVNRIDNEYRTEYSNQFEQFLIVGDVNFD